MMRLYDVVYLGMKYISFRTKKKKYMRYSHKCNRENFQFVGQI